MWSPHLAATGGGSLMTATAAAVAAHAGGSPSVSRKRMRTGRGFQPPAKMVRRDGTAVPPQVATVAQQQPQQPGLPVPLAATAVAATAVSAAAVAPASPSVPLVPVPSRYAVPSFATTPQMAPQQMAPLMTRNDQLAALMACYRQQAAARPGMQFVGQATAPAYTVLPQPHPQQFQQRHVPMPLVTGQFPHGAMAAALAQSRPMGLSRPVSCTSTGQVSTPSPPGSATATVAVGSPPAANFMPAAAATAATPTAATATAYAPLPAQQTAPREPPRRRRAKRHAVTCTEPYHAVIVCGSRASLVASWAVADEVEKLRTGEAPKSPMDAAPDAEASSSSTPEPGEEGGSKPKDDERRILQIQSPWFGGSVDVFHAEGARTEPLFRASDVARRLGVSGSRLGMRVARDKTQEKSGIFQAVAFTRRVRIEATSRDVRALKTGTYFLTRAACRRVARYYCTASEFDASQPFFEAQSPE